MPLDRPSRERLLERSRELWEARDFPSLAAELEPLPADELVEEPALGYLLADARQRLGELDRALELVRRIAPACVRRGNDRLSRDRLNLEGILLFGRGDMGGAEEAWTRLLDSAMRADDATMVARAGHNFGVLHTLRGEWERALVSHERAAAAYQRLGYLRGLAQVHNNLGMTYREMGFFRKADRHFLQALEYAQVTQSHDEAGRVRIERALLLCYDGDVELAGVTARFALGVWERLGDALHRGEAHRVLGIVALGRGRWEEMERHAHAALELARETGATLLEAEVTDLLAVVARHAGDDARAASHRERAASLFAGMGATAWGAALRWRLEEMAA